MRFRRKSDAEPETTGDDQTPAPVVGPYDIDDVPADQLSVERLDLGSLLLRPPVGFDLRLQFDQKSGNILSVLVAAETGALELRAFGAPRDGDLWGETMVNLKADVERRSGQATEVEGRFGPELMAQIPTTMPNGEQGWNVSRFMGFNGPRWLLRATLVGQPALKPDDRWYAVVETLVVRRGKQPVPVGEQLPISVPDELAERLNQAAPGESGS
ncbi:DUF3710 domain-containing protein [soil metagenome]